MIVSNIIDEFVHIQSVPASVWVVEHNMEGYPSVTVIDSGNSQVEGDVIFDSVNQVTLQFSSAFAGTAVFR